MSMPALAALAAAAFLLSPATRAEPPSAERVAYDDLNLSRPSHVRKLRLRLETAVQRVCPAGPERPDAPDMLSDETMFCRAAARDEARRQLGAILERQGYRQVLARQ